MPDQNITIQTVSLENVLAFKEKTLTLGKKATIISGKNHSFKTCLIEAIKAGISGGTIKDKPLVHEGEERGKITITTSDDKEFVKTLYYDKASKLSVTGAGGISATEALSELFGAAYIDPVKMYNADPEKRVEMLYSVLPLKFDRQSFGNLVGGKILPNSNALAEIGSWHKKYYEERTGANRDLKKAEVRLNDARRALPLSEPQNPSERIAELTAERAKIVNTFVAATNSARTKEESHKRTLSIARDEAIAKANDEYNKGIESLSVRVKAYNEKQQIILHEAIAPIDTELGALREKERNFERDALLEKNFEKIQKEHDDAKADAEKLDETVKAIELVRDNLIRDTSIDGVDVKDGEVWIDGTTWQYVNRARKLIFCNQMAERSCGAMKLIVVDDMESLDAENRQLQLEHIAKSDFQYVMAEVDRDAVSEDMRIERIG